MFIPLLLLRKNICTFKYQVLYAVWTLIVWDWHCNPGIHTSKPCHKWTKLYNHVNCKFWWEYNILLPVQPYQLFSVIISVLLVLLSFQWIIPFFERTILLSLSFQLLQASCLFLLFLCPNGKESDSKVILTNKEMSLDHLHICLQPPFHHQHTNH